MRHKYSTRALVLSRISLAESSVLVTLLTEELGLVRARAAGLRKPGAKLAGALQTLTEADVAMVRGKDGWRLTGALTVTAWFPELDASARARAGRIFQLVLRLVHTDAPTLVLYPLLCAFLAAILDRDEELQDAAECLVALRLLRELGLTAGEIPGTPYDFGRPILEQVLIERLDYIARINKGLAESGL